jgi:hypothetical protein
VIGDYVFHRQKIVDAMTIRQTLIRLTTIGKKHQMKTHYAVPVVNHDFEFFWLIGLIDSLSIGIVALNILHQLRFCLFLLIVSYVRLVLPKLPTDGVEAVVKHLTSEQLLAHVSFHIGTKDLVMSEATHFINLNCSLTFVFSGASSFDISSKCFPPTT